MKTDKFKLEQDYSQLQALNSTLNEEIAHESPKLKKWQTDSSMLNGLWQVWDTGDSSSSPNFYQITNGVVYNESRRTEELFQIKNFHYNPDSSEVTFVFYDIENAAKSLFFLLNAEDWDVMRGSKNLSSEVTFRKIRVVSRSLYIGKT